MKKYRDRKDKVINCGFNIAFLTTAITTGLKISNLRDINDLAVQQYHTGTIKRPEMLKIMQEVADKEETVGVIFLSVMGALLLANTVYNVYQDMKEK